MGVAYIGRLHSAEADRAASGSIMRMPLWAIVSPASRGSCIRDASFGSSRLGCTEQSGGISESHATSPSPMTHAFFSLFLFSAFSAFIIRIVNWYFAMSPCVAPLPTTQVGIQIHPGGLPSILLASIVAKKRDNQSVN